MTSWKHGCFLAEYLRWSVQWMSTSIYFSSFCLLFFSVLRHLQPAVQLLFVSQLARQLAEQLDCERGCCQPTWRVSGKLETWMLLGRVFDMVFSMDVNISLSPSHLLFLSVLRHLQPAVKLLFLSQLAQQLAEQLDCERGCCQPPVFEATAPLSDSQLQKFPVPDKLKSLCVTFQSCSEGVQCLDQCLKERGTQEVLEFSDG